MSEADSGAVVRKFFEAMNGHNLDQVASLASEDVEFVDVAAGEEIHGRDQWRQYCGRYLKAFPDMRLEQTNLAAMGDSAVVEAIARGTHDGALESPAGEIAPTGRKIEMRFCLVVRVRDGEIVDSREYYDAMALMSQLGLMPEPAQATTTS
jgi:steroid delta-isomerase-like uncharacterized protein